jgi:hypothetical protein
MKILSTAKADLVLKVLQVLDCFGAGYGHHCRVVGSFELSDHRNLVSIQNFAAPFSGIARRSAQIHR